MGRAKFQTNPSFHFENKHCPFMILQALHGAWEEAQDSSSAQPLLT